MTQPDAAADLDIYLNLMTHCNGDD